MKGGKTLAAVSERRGVKRALAVLAAVLGAIMAALVGIVFYYFLGFGIETSCTDKYGNASPHSCAASYDWLTMGLIGESCIAVGLLALGSVALSGHYGTTWVRRSIAGGILASILWAVLTDLAATHSY